MRHKNRARAHGADSVALIRLPVSLAPVSSSQEVEVSQGCSSCSSWLRLYVGRLMVRWRVEMFWPTALRVKPTRRLSFSPERGLGYAGLG